MDDILAFWSLVSMIMRVVALLGLSYVLYKQVLQFRKKQLYPNENSLKRLLVSLVTMLAISNVPIMILHYERIRGVNASDSVTSLATVTNAFSMVAVAIILLLIYGFRGQGDDE